MINSGRIDKPIICLYSCTRMQLAVERSKLLERAAACMSIGDTVRQIKQGSKQDILYESISIEFSKQKQG